MPTDTKQESRREIAEQIVRNFAGYANPVDAIEAILEGRESDQLRGLTLISALINFVDWLDRGGLLKSLPERERARLVLQFFDAHQHGENYFLQAEQIMEILGEPFVREESTNAN